MAIEFAFWHFAHEDTGGAQISGQYPLYDRGHIAEVPDAATRSRWAASSKASLILLFDPATPGPIGASTPSTGAFTTLLAATDKPVYHRGNILAAVSQSGGAPTGGVIERSSNANGAYVRFADGTQICTFAVSWNASAGALQNFAMPASFASAGRVPCSISFPGTSVAANLATFRDTIVGVNSGSTFWQVMTDSVQDAAHEISLLAIGRWF